MFATQAGLPMLCNWHCQASSRARVHAVVSARETMPDASWRAPGLGPPGVAGSLPGGCCHQAPWQHRGGLAHMNTKGLYSGTASSMWPKWPGHS